MTAKTTQPAGAQSPSEVTAWFRQYVEMSKRFNEYTVTCGYLLTAVDLIESQAARIASRDEEIAQLSDDLQDARDEHNAAHAALAEAQRDAARYRWLKEHGPTYHGACQGTASMSIGRGPYIYLEVPAHNNFSNLVLNGDSADGIIDAALSSTGEGGRS